MNPKRLVPLSAWLVLLGFCAWIALTQTQVITNMGQFMPAAKNAQQQLLLNQLQHGAATRVLLMAIAGPSSRQTAQFSKQFAARLRGNPLFILVSNGEQRQSAPEQDLLLRYRYLFSAQVSAERFSAASTSSISVPVSPI